MTHSAAALALALLAYGAPAGLDHAGRHLPARARISNVTWALLDERENAYLVDACRDFRLTERQIRIVLSRARTITPQQRTQHFLEAPCGIRGTARWDQTSVEFEISATLIAKIQFPDGSVRVLGCAGACEKSVWRTVPTP
jgi:hypothetical protein